jgi:hypothetical protein
MATRCPGIGGDDGSFHTEFVRRAGLALPMHSTSGAWKEYSFQPRWRCCCEQNFSPFTKEILMRLEVRVACDLAPCYGEDIVAKPFSRQPSAGDPLPG